MANTATDTDVLIAFVLLSDPRQVGLARCLVRATLEYRRLGDYIDDAAIIASELVTNAIEHASAGEPGAKIGLTLIHVWEGQAIGVVVTDTSRIPPVRRETTGGDEHGRGLHVVEALSARWGWIPEPGGKAVYAILTRDQ
jgi:anti-sigma regulatory factor (Ser/Thr protein kinase)